MDQVILNFLKNNYFVAVYGITWFISVFTYKKYFDTVLRYFPILIAYTFFSELLGGIIAKNQNFQLIFGYEHVNHNSVLYNLYHLCFFLFFNYVYWRVTENQKKKQLLVYGGIAFILVNIGNSLFQNPLVESLIAAYLFGTLLLLYAISIYFKERLKKFPLSTLKHSLLFWVSTGLLIFHATYFPLKLVREYDYYYYAPFRQFHLIMIVTMYVVFSFGFIFSKRRAFR